MSTAIVTSLRGKIRGYIRKTRVLALRVVAEFWTTAEHSFRKGQPMAKVQTLPIFKGIPITMIRVRFQKFRGSRPSQTIWQICRRLIIKFCPMTASRAKRATSETTQAKIDT